MQASTENKRINIKLAQIQTALQSDREDTDWIFKNKDNINEKVVATKYLQLGHAEWIGNTALHFAVDENKSEAFIVLLNQGADFTIKNNNGLTALHMIMQKLLDCTSVLYKLDNPFVHSVLSAHLKYTNFENPCNVNGLSHFHVACAANNIKAVKGFLQNNVFVNQAVEMDSPIFPGFTSLHFAAKYCAFEVADLLLTCSADAHIKDAKGMTPLHIALERKIEIINDADTDETLRDTNDKILQLLMNKESNCDVVNIDDWGLSNFHVSCALRDNRIAKCYLQKIINVNDSVNVDSPLWAGYTALHFAALCNVDTVKLLMRNGADINIKDAKGVTAFDMCIERYKNEDISQIISLNSIWRNVVLSDGKTKLSDLIFAMRDLNSLYMFLSEHNEDISICRDSPLWPGCSAMHLAVILAKKDTKSYEESEQTILQITERFSKEILTMICEQRSSMLQHQNVQGCTPIHLAFRLNKKSLVNTLLDFLEDYSKLEDRVAEDGLSFVHITSAQNDPDLLERLLSKGSNVNTIYKGKSQFLPMIYSGSTALHFAVANETSKVIIDILIEYDADVYIKDSNDMTPIHFALISGDTELAEKLVSLPNLQDSVVSGVGLSHLHVACWCEASDAVYQLLNNGADINLQINCQQNINSDLNLLLESFEGYSPLTLAYDLCEVVSATLLVKYGADIFVKSKKGIALLYNVLDDYDLCVHEFLATVRRNKAFMTRLKAETGMTSLHLACFEGDIDLIKKLLSEGENVNAQIPLDSPILQGYTPLHILMHSGHEQSDDHIIEVIELLVKAGADVTLESLEMGTSVHMTYAWVNYSKDANVFLDTLLEAQRDFTINPTNIYGISHFHIASHICNIDIVEKFLNYGVVDVNQPIDYFCRDDYLEAAGNTALHLVASSRVKLCGLAKQLDTIDLLLNHGADARAENRHGNTPFHVCARCNSLDIFERLMRRGADINVRNIDGETPLHYYLKSNDVSVEGIKTLTRFGCRLNLFNFTRSSGIIGQLLHALSFEDLDNLFSALVVNFEQQMQIDNLGRTVIHNIVSTESPKITANQYAQLINRMSRMGCDIDDQDNLGRTALHIAVKFYNSKAISGLLLAGADINIVDGNGKTALACGFDTCTQCDNKKRNEEDECKHIETLETLATYIKKLQLCGLDVNKQNEDFTAKALETVGKLPNEIKLSDGIFKELEAVKRMKIKSHSLTLGDFLSEYGAVVDYPRMSEIKRNDVKQFFSTSNVLKIREKFPELAEILQLQYRKAAVRSKLVESATNALKVLMRLRLPEICSNFILRLLKNSELMNLISSTIPTEDKKLS